MSTEANAKIFSVIGGCRRSGRWLVPASTNMLTLFGRAFIDLREARTSADELEFSCLSVFANVTFIVPEGAEVRPSGTAILGSSRSTVPVTDASCQLPPISVDATTVFGRMRIRTTDTDPEDDERKQNRRGLFRRRERAADRDHVADAGAPATTPADDPGGVDLAPAERSGGVEPLPGATPRRTATSGAGARDEAPPSGRRPSRPVLDDDEVIGGGSATVSAPVDLSAPIPAFEDDDVSPIHDVAVPDTLAGTAADAEAPAGPPVFAADDEPVDDEGADDEADQPGAAADEAVIGGTRAAGDATTDGDEEGAAATADVVG